MTKKNSAQITFTQTTPDYKTEIVKILRSNLTPLRIREELSDYHEKDIAAALELLKREERIKLYSSLDVEMLANILEYSGSLSEYLSELSVRKQVQLLSLLEIPTTVEYLQKLGKMERNMLMELMNEELRQEITLLSSFDEDEIGSKMTTNYISISDKISVRDAMKELIRQAAENDNISTIYVTDSNAVFVGAIDLKDLIIARENTQLEAITITSYPYVYADEPIESCMERIRHYSEDSIPVLNADNKLIGVLTSQDITQLVDDEFSEDYAKLAGLSAEEDLQEPLRMSIKKRLPWLVILLGLGLGVSSVVGLFEEVVAHLTIIISFQSLILDMAGNVGTQSLAVTIRVLMDEQLTAKQKLFLVGKEARIGLINGFILGSLSFACIGFYLMLFKSYPAAFAFSVSFCTGTALITSILLSSICGTVIPLIFKKLNVDPAVASGPLITTINDLVAVISYYGLAWLLLIERLHL